MKNLILVMTTIFLTAFSLEAQTDKENAGNNTHKNYCATLQDGLLIIKNDGQVLKSDTPLSNGAIIKLDGSVIKSDGTQFILKLGECIDNKGNPVKTVDVPTLNEEKNPIPNKKKK